jgi:carbonic anhydrase
MPNDSLLQGNKEFVENLTAEQDERLEKLTVEGQKPTTLFIGCCDSRVSPSIMTNSNIGELFIARNIGNFVAPYGDDKEFHAGAAAIEYAVSVLKVSNIIVCGHSHCGAIESLYKIKKLDKKKFKSTRKWLTLGKRARKDVKKFVTNKTTKREKLEMTEKLSAIYQLDNLMTYPSVKKRVKKGKLELNVWYYDIQTGVASYYDKDKGDFIVE